MIGSTLSHFRILDKLGEGGMGVVYRAEDTNLGRHVALKVLHAAFVTDDERRQRFLREARTAAALNHPNIATIHEVGEQDGVIFIAMELVEGRPLVGAIRDGAHSADAALRIAIDIAEGLARAHQAGIVHRDLKPDNVVLDRDGRVKILDFGLAKLYQSPGDGRGDTSALQTLSTEMTRDGRILGTVAYMSPEQARGLDVDARSDVFSLGIVVYELVTGTRPFSGETITDTLTAILRDRQPPIARFNPQVPAELERIVARCLEKDPAARYPHAGEMLADLRALKRLTDSQPVPLVSDSGPAAPVGRPRWLRPLPLAGGAAVLAAVALAGALTAPLLLGRASRAIESLAVLPFVNLEQQDDPERLGQILQELIITDLSEQGSVRVFSSQRLFDLQKQLGRDRRPTIDPDVAAEVARRAGARVMLTGSLSQLNSMWILAVQLVDVDSGAVLKSERIDGSDLYEMVDELTSVVRRDLGLAGAIDVAVEERTSDSLDAYRTYLSGVEAMNALEFSEAARRFERAIEVDPDFGQAYYKLAISRWWDASLNAQVLGTHMTSAPVAALEEMLDGGTKLSRKERALGEAFRDLLAQRPQEAAPQFERLVEEFPDDKEAWYGLGEARFHDISDPDGWTRSVEAFERALELDPSFALSLYHVVDVYLREGRVDDGIERVRALVARDPDKLPWYRDWARLAVDRGDAPSIEELVAAAVTGLDSRGDQRLLLAGLAEELADAKADPDVRDRVLDRAESIESPAAEHRLAVARAELALDRGDVEGARRDLLALHAAEPRDTRALRAVFRSWERTRDWDAGIAYARELVEADPDHAPFQAYLVSFAIRGGRPDRVADVIAAATDRLRAGDDSGSRVLMAAAVTWAEMGDRQRAVELAEQGVEHVPDPMRRADLYGFLATNDLLAERFARARERAAAALERNPNQWQALATSARAHLALGDAAGAVAAAERLAATGMAKGEAAGLEAGILFLAGDAARARSAVAAAERKTTSATSLASFHRELAATLLTGGRHEDALPHAERALELGGARPAPGTFGILAASLAGVGRPAEAVQALERGLAVHPNHPELLSELPLALLAAGDARRAETVARDLVERGPATALARTGLAYALAEQGRFEEALAAVRAADAMASTRAVRTLEAWIRVRGDLDRERGVELARAAGEMPPGLYERALRFPFVPCPEHVLGVAAIERGDYARAVELLERAARRRPDRTSIRADLERATRLRTSVG